MTHSYRLTVGQRKRAFFSMLIMLPLASAATLVCFLGFLYREFDYKVR